MEKIKHAKWSCRPTNHRTHTLRGGIKKNYRLNVASSLKSYIIIIIIVQWRKYYGLKKDKNEN